MIYYDRKQDGWVDLRDKDFWIPVERVEANGIRLMESEKSLKFDDQDQFFLWFYENF
jgi:hypothetical protein